MKKVILIVFACCLLSFSVYAADTENPITTELDSGWAVTTNGYPTGSISSWFNIIRQLILTGNATLSDVQSQLTNYMYNGLRQNWTINGGNNALWGNNSWYGVVNSNLYSIRTAVQGLVTAAQMSGYFNSLETVINADTASIITQYSNGIETISNRLDDYLGSYDPYRDYIHISSRSNADRTPIATVTPSSPGAGRFPLLLIYDSAGRLNLGDMGKDVDSPMDMLSILNSNVFMLGNELMTFNTNYRSANYDMASGTIVRNRAYSIADMLDVAFGSIVESVGRLAYIFADDDAIALKQANAENVSAVVDDFFTPTTGRNSVKLSDIGSVSDLGGHFSGSLDSGGSVSGFISGTSSNGGLFSWFTEECAAELDSTSSSSSLMLMSKGTSQYEDYYYQFNLGESDLYD